MTIEKILWPTRGALDWHIFLVVRSETGHSICMCKIFWPKFSICDLICHVYILFEPVYNILHNEIQIWTFDSNNRIDLLWKLNYIHGFFIQTDPTFNSNSFTKYFQHLTSWKIVPCLQCLHGKAMSQNSDLASSPTPQKGPHCKGDSLEMSNTQGTHGNMFLK